MHKAGSRNTDIMEYMTIIFETSVQEQIMNRPRDSFDCSTKGSIRYINLIVLYVLRYIVGFTCDYLMFLEQMDLLTVCDTPAFP